MSAAPMTVAPGPAAPVETDVLEVLAKGSLTFHFASRFLAPSVRRDAATLYAFCRWVDDAADEAPSVDEAHRALDRIEAALRGLHDEPVLRPVMALFDRRGIDPVHALDLVDGVRSDLGRVRVASDRELVRYAYAVASTVGLMMCGVLGVTDRRALPHAIDLGVAMQLTNICRDVAEDARMGRVYLPATRLTGVGVEPEPEAVLDASEGVRHVVADLLDLADRYYASGERGMHFIPTGARLAILVASRVYRAIGVRLRRLGGDPLQGRTVVPTAAKVWTALRALLSFPSVSWPSRLDHDPALHRFLHDRAGADPAARPSTPPTPPLGTAPRSP